MMMSKGSPIESIRLKSKLISPVVLSFDVVLPDDVLRVKFSYIPDVGEPWSYDYSSEKYGSGLISIINVVGGSYTTPTELATALCRQLRVPASFKIRNIEKNCIDLTIPGFVERSLVIPNRCEQDPSSKRVLSFVLFADLRGFSDWSLNTAPEHTTEVYDLISQGVVNMFVTYRYDFWKLLGDGVMLIWEGESNESDAADAAIGAAHELHSRYFSFKEDAPYEIPSGFGTAICGGFATKYQSRTFFETIILQDYIGPVVNQAARLQTLAKPGQVLVNRRIQRATSVDWYSFENVTSKLGKRLTSLKGLSEFEREIYLVTHKYHRY